MKSIQLIALALGIAFSFNTTAETNNLSYSGIVTDPEGHPIAGAAVALWHHDMQAQTPGMKQMQSTTSGTNGAFELTIGTNSGQVVVTKTGLAPTWKHLYPQYRTIEGEQRFILGSLTNIAGVVVDEANKPVADAEVFVTSTYLICADESYEYLNGQCAKKMFAARTGADGRFSIEGFLTNAVADLGVTKSGKVLHQQDREYRGPDTMMCRSGQQDIKLVLEPAGSIEGKIVAEEGTKTLPQPRLWLQPDGNPQFYRDLPTSSVTNGVFTFADVAPGSYRVSAAFGTNAIADCVAESVQVTVTGGETTRNVQVKAVTGGFLEATVISSVDRKPLAGVYVNAFAQSYRAGNATDTNGIALFRMPAGEYKAQANPGNSRAEDATTVKIETGQTNRIQFESAPAPSITGRVLNPDGTPAAGASVKVMPEHGMRSSATTDTNGHYELKWTQQNFGGGSGPTYCLLVRDTKRNLAVAQEIDESTKTADLHLTTGQIITGRVEDSNGKPITNAAVHIVFWTGNMGAWIDQGKIKIDAQGRFEASALPRDRRYSAGVTAKGYGSADSQSLQEAGDRIEVPTFTLARADKKLAGRVVDADDKPVVGVRISSYGNGQPRINAKSDSKGEFSADVCEGTINLSAYKQNSHGSVRAQGGDTNVVIKLGVQRGGGMPQPPKRPSLTGRALPDLASVGFASDVAPAGKPVLLCLFDVEQRPSRRFARQLVDQYDALRQKGVTLLGVQAAIASADAIKQWKDANPVPFPMAIVAEKSATNKWVMDVESLPWLILTDEKGQVTAEGFGLEELDARLTAKP